MLGGIVVLPANSLHSRAPRMWRRRRWRYIAAAIVTSLNTPAAWDRVDAFDWDAGPQPGPTAHALPMLPTPEQITAERASAAEAEQQAADQGDTHLRSASEVSGYVIRALDGDLGRVEDVLFDDRSWATRYLVVDTNNWWFGKHVRVAPEWIADISWQDRSVSVNVTRQRLKTAPQYDRAEHVDRQWEADYYQHLERPGYWLTAEDARAIKEAQSYLHDEPDRHAASVERRSRPR